MSGTKRRISRIAAQLDAASASAENDKEIDRLQDFVINGLIKQILGGKLSPAELDQLGIAKNRLDELLKKDRKKPAAYCRPWIGADDWRPDSVGDWLLWTLDREASNGGELSPGDNEKAQLFLSCIDPELKAQLYDGGANEGKH